MWLNFWFILLISLCWNSRQHRSLLGIRWARYLLILEASKNELRKCSKICFFIGPTQANIIVYFWSFQANIITNFITNICEKCPSSIRCGISKPWPLEHESPPITTRPGLLPFLTVLIYIQSIKLLTCIITGTASYFKQLGLLNASVDSADEETDINILLQMALARLAFMPFGYLVSGCIFICCPVVIRLRASIYLPMYIKCVPWYRCRSLTWH